MEFVEGSRAGWFFGGLFMVAFGAVVYFLYKKIKAQRDEDKDA